MWLRIGLAFLAFFIYACGVLSLHQDRHSLWEVEIDFSLAAAVSHTVYGTPLGNANANVVREFRTFHYNISRQDPNYHDHISVLDVMARTATGELPAGNALKTHTDGIGAGYPIFSSLAMQLFGPHLSALTYSFLLLLGISTLAFICRFQDERLFMVPLLFFALTLMLLSPLAADSEVSDQIPIGGYRYFTIACILPALHIFFEFAARSPRRTKETICNLLLMGLQVVMFAFVMLVRSSALYLLGPIVLAALFGIWANWRTPPELRQMLSKIAVAVVASIAFFSITATSVPDYVNAGRLFGNTWHRAFVSFGLHPDWPFGNLREVYNCTDFRPEGLVKGTVDGNAFCVFWSSYPPAVTGDLSEADVDAHLYDGVYEKVLRSAFFDVVLSYPRQILELYVYHKSASIIQTLRESVRLDLSAQTATLLALAALQCSVFFAFIALGTYRRTNELTRRTAIVFVLFVFSLVPLYFAWSSLHTSIDTIAFMYAGAATIFGILIQTPLNRIFGVPRSVMPTLPSTGAPVNAVRVALVVVIGAAVAWGSGTYFMGGPSIPTTFDKQIADVSALPLLPGSSSAPNEWDLIEGLGAAVVEKPVVVAGQRILQLVAVGADRRHALGVHFGDLAPSGIYRATAWVKAEPGVRVMIEARDAVDPLTGKPSNYGVARFNLADRSIINSTGDILASGVEVAADDWVKLWVDLRSRDGDLFVTIGLLEGPNNQHVFAATSQTMTFGGIEISPPRPAQTSPQAGTRH